MTGSRIVVGFDPRNPPGEPAEAPQDPPKPSRRGFAGMDPERVREIARLGGAAGGHRFSSADAAAAGALGGKAGGRRWTAEEARDAGARARIAREARLRTSRK